MRKKSNQYQSVNALIVVIVLCLLIYFIFPRPPFSLNDMEKRAVWVSYQDLEKLNYSTSKGFEKSFEEVCKNSMDYGCNTLIVHVRAFQDALYKTYRFSFSKVMTGKTVLSFDPLKIMIKIAHKYELKFEAWINPYRISLNSYTYNQFVNDSPIKSWIRDPSKVIHYGEYMYILNPASDSVRDYIVNGIEEIVRNYDVDGIHFDDYFYVEGTYNNLSQNSRLENVNRLIKEVYQSIKRIKKNVVFGISPQGNYENCLIGGADVDTWLNNENYIDYLMPQIYWSNQYYSDGKTTMFSNRVKKWVSLKRNKKINLYVGLALYQAGQDLDYDKGWSSSDENICSQIEILKKNNIQGYSLFHYSYLLDKNGKKEMDNLLKKHSLDY